MANKKRQHKAGAFLSCGGSSEGQLQGKLHESGIVHSLVDHPEGRWGVYVLLARSGNSRHEELRVIEEVEEFSAELEVGSLTEAEREFFDQREIGVHEARPVHGSTRGDAEFSRGCFRKGAGVEPILKSVDLGGSGAARIS